MSREITKRCPPCQQDDHPNCATPLIGGPGSGFALGCCCDLLDLLDDPGTPGLGIPLHVEHVTFAGGVRELEAHLHELRQRARAEEAEMTAVGWRFLSIAHGDPETQQHVDALTQVARTFHAQPTRGRRQIAGGNDYTTYRAGPPAEDAEQVIAATRAVAEEHNPGHWHITPTAHPDFGWGPVP
jgi:hypothetical protein